MVVGLKDTGTPDHGLPGRETNRPVGDLSDQVREFAAGLKPDATYRAPTSAQRRDSVAGLRRLFDGEGAPAAREALRPLGFSVTTGTDPATGRKYAVVLSERAWGMYVMDLSAPVRLVVEVPHPNFDLRTELIGLALFRRVPGAVLMVSGTHRRAAGNEGDVAHRVESLFHAVAEDLAKRDVPQVQLHGFHDQRLPDTDVVVSPGAADASAAVRRVAGQLEDVDLAICRAWTEDCANLEGTRNQQGRTAAAHRSLFLHLEISRTVREDESRWPRLVAALVAGLPKQ